MTEVSDGKRQEKDSDTPQTRSHHDGQRRLQVETHSFLAIPARPAASRDPRHRADRPPGPPKHGASSRCVPVCPRPHPGMATLLTGQTAKEGRAAPGGLTCRCRRLLCSALSEPLEVKERGWFCGDRCQAHTGGGNRGAGPVCGGFGEGGSHGTRYHRLPEARGSATLCRVQEKL